MSNTERFYEYLINREGLSESTAREHERRLFSYEFQDLSEKYFPERAWCDLDALSELYVLQAKLCIDGVERWREFWTSIDHWRRYTKDVLQPKFKKDTLVDTGRVIIESIQLALDRLKKCVNDKGDIAADRLQFIMDGGSSLNGLISISMREEELTRREKQLERREMELAAREKEMNIQYQRLSELQHDFIEQNKTGKKAGRKEKDSREILRNTYSPDDLELLKAVTADICEKEHLTKSPLTLLFLMVVMRQKKIIVSKYSPRSFVRLLCDWNILKLSFREQNKLANNISQQYSTEHNRRMHDVVNVDLNDKKWQQFTADEWTICQCIMKHFDNDERFRCVRSNQ